MRNVWTLAHRWLGLATAAFLIMSGTTGAVISWDEEIDEWLNPQLFKVESRGPTLQPLELAARIETADPRAWVQRVPLRFEPGETAMFWIMPRVNPETKRLYELGYNEVYIDPVTGKVVGKRDRGKAALNRQHFVPFLYQLHQNLYIPEIAGTDRWGYWLMGAVAVAFLFNNIIGAYLTFPERSTRWKSNSMGAWWRRWKPAWKVNWRADFQRVNFDLHRSLSLWAWCLLIVLAFSAASQNLFLEVFRPALKAVSTITPGPYDVLEEQPLHHPVIPKIGFARVIDIARVEAGKRKWVEPMGSAYYDERFGYYSVSFYFPGQERGFGGGGPRRFFIHADDGRLIGVKVPWEGTGADLFMRLQFPVHSGRLLGLPGRILISITGLAVATLSITGIIIWLRKRRMARATTRLPPDASAST